MPMPKTFLQSFQEHLFVEHLRPVAFEMISVVISSSLVMHKFFSVKALKNSTKSNYDQNCLCSWSGHTFLVFKKCFQISQTNSC